MTGRESLFPAVPPDEQIRRLHDAVETMACWLAEAQTGFSERDVQGILNILEHGEARPDA